MKKTQVALAALALVASTAAVANGVTVYGAVDAAVAHSNGGKGTYFDGTGSWTAPSHLGFKGSEDLGNGMKASFQLETGVSLGNGAAVSGGTGGATAQANGFGALFTRVATVGLSGDFGAVNVGQQLSPYIVPNVVGAGAGMGPGSFFVNRMILSGYGAAAVNMAGSTNFNYDGFFIPNSINYTSPSLNGWTVNAMTTTKAGAKDGTISTAADTDSYQAYTLGGAVGSIGVMAGYQTRKNVNSSYTLAATVPLTSDLTLAASYISNDETKGYGNGYKIGSTSVFFNYRLSDALSTQLGYARNDLANEATLTSVSMKYDLSKRTFTYASYGHGTGGADPSFANRGGFTFNSATASSVSNFAVGVGHSF
jgi:predicted porin